MEDLIKLRDAFRKVADILDEIVRLGDDPKNEERMEELYGKFLIHMLKIKEMSESM
ncbi:MAG: hypothetical protein E6X21_14985 [Clostridium sp.]|uniref:hypothetical protein n=1 Tax=Clostridium sp. TaxID=1506 RepID=UPI00290CBCF8|nr:hypothetical protein [Clostridium sp.]